MNENDYLEFTIALVDRTYSHGTESNIPFVKWGSNWAIPGSEGTEQDTLADIQAYPEYSNIRVLKPGSHEWVLCDECGPK